MRIDASNWKTVYPCLGGLAFVVSLALTGLSILLLRRLRMMDEPEAGKFHTRATPRMAGPAMWLAFAVSLMVFSSSDARALSIIVGGLIVLLVGVWDDIRRTSAVVKLVALALVTWIMSTQGVATSLFRSPWLNFAVTLPWVVGVTSALNAMDNMDGLGGGIAFIATALFAFVAVQTGQYAFGAVSLALGGAVLGFLVFNRPRARIFMGDSVSLFLGYALAAISVMGGWSTHPVKASLVPILILSVPLVDLGYVIVTRWVSGEARGIGQAIVYNGLDHFSHRLMNLGLTSTQAVGFLLTLSLAIGLLAVALRNSLPSEAVLLAVQVCLIYGLFLYLMKKAGNRHV